jgi:hypothetical protein
MLYSNKVNSQISSSEWSWNAMRLWPWPSPQVVCPRCLSANLGRSHRVNALERVISKVRILPFRCQDCHLRFWIIGSRIWASRAALKDTGGDPEG